MQPMVGTTYKNKSILEWGDISATSMMQQKF